MSKIKINIISIFFPPEIGAAPSRIFKLANTLSAQSDIDVEIITALPNYPEGKIFSNYRKKLWVVEQIGNLSIRRYWLYPSTSKNPILRIFSMFSFSLSSFLSLRHLWKRKPKLLIINSPPLLVGFSSVLLAKLCRAKILLNISDLWPLSALELGAIKKGRFYSILEFVERFIYKKADCIMAQSEESLSHINRLVNKPTFLYRNMDLPSPYLNLLPEYDPTNIKIIYAGLLGVAQGVFGICQNVNFKELGVEFHIYGSGNEFELITDFIKKNPDSNIYLYKTVPKEAIPLILSKFHATLIPLKKPIYGAFPSKVFMAIASGLPIIFSGEGEGANFVMKHELGWVSKSEDYCMLTDNILKLKNMGSEAFFEMKRHCITKCIDNFNEKKQQQEFLDFMNQFYKKV